MKRRNQGFVLITVLGVLALLTLLTLGFGRRALLERRAAAVSLDYAQASMQARGAVQRAMMHLQNQASMEAFRDFRQRGTAKLSWREHLSVSEEGLLGADEAEEDGNVVDYTIEDVESRISLNAAPEELLEELDGLGFGAVNRILERRGKDSDRKDARPYLAVEELRELEDIDDDAWFGTRENAGLARMLTTWGDGRINVNTASRDVLRTIPDLDADVMEAVLAYRAGSDGTLGTPDDTGFASWSAMAKALNVSMDKLMPLQRFCKLESRFFTITGFAVRRQGKIRAYCTAVVEIEGRQMKTLQWWEGAVGT